MAVLLLFTWVDSHLGNTLVQALAQGQRRQDELREANRALEDQRNRLQELTVRQERANDALARANEELRSFTYAVSHDLRAPLINIRGFAGELRRDLAVLEPICERQLPAMPDQERAVADRALHEDVPEALRFIDSSVERMDALIAAILKLSRLGHRELRREPVDTAAVLQQTLATIEHAIQARGVSIEVAELPTILSDTLAITQIFSNLLANAVAYLQPGRPGRIRVSAHSEEHGQVRFAVEDNGRGIAAGSERVIFELFRRVGPTTEPGEGMGLAYVDALVRNQGGRVWCESTLGVGSTFYFTIGTDPIERRSGGT